MDRHGIPTPPPFWTGSCLPKRSDKLRICHKEFVDAGSNLITTATYQATINGFLSKGLSEEEAAKSIGFAVSAARKAADGHPDVKVAASIGPYGAFLCNGSEYRGDYEVHVDTLLEFHKSRWQILAHYKPDLILCETIPCLQEVETLIDVAKDSSIPAWISLQCDSPTTLASGECLTHCIKLIAESERFKAVGANCFHLGILDEIVEIFIKNCDLPIFFYPNMEGSLDSGALAAAFKPYIHHPRFIMYAGCCGTTPEQISKLKEMLDN